MFADFRLQPVGTFATHPHPDSPRDSSSILQSVPTAPAVTAITAIRRATVTAAREIANGCQAVEQGFSIKREHHVAQLEHLLPFALPFTSDRHDCQRRPLFPSGLEQLALLGDLPTRLGRHDQQNSRRTGEADRLVRIGCQQ